MVRGASWVIEAHMLHGKDYNEATLPLILYHKVKNIEHMHACNCETHLIVNIMTLSHFYIPCFITIFSHFFHDHF